jgi:hypothetical protein
MKEFIQDDDLDYELILDRGFRTQGDEDFAVFHCPVCKRIYLVEYEGDTLFSCPEDPSVLQSLDSSFRCLSCENPFSSEEPIIGPRANDRYGVTRDELLASTWSWLLRSPKGSNHR